jgi:hypothetical protein
LDLLTYSIYIFVSLTRLFLNLYTAHSDVGGTDILLVLCVVNAVETIEKFVLDSFPSY